ncbi:MAG TPA: SUMF1/EgtB/PvdO family nonheme iron enzyme [bacterium]|nr:SUMF1/EgtB/PvdO family nonheme iron enzyme [bacterium]HQG44834.1 SUMF1/EgtB/PvdO family nonheme iron enzyme [bacterium]HQI48947.1 SUMF1/EgtB/PvdO family nonheme iron enzyme [bacterium]HQJ64124.1 SUMF1/EgtB/PvdO family nonheme iron enzyme [bacterium]
MIFPLFRTVLCCSEKGQVQKDRVLRGGSWNNNQNNVRCANRNRNNPGNRNDNIGFRVVLSPRFSFAGIVRRNTIFRIEAKNGGACSWLCGLVPYRRISTVPPPRPCALRRGIIPYVYSTIAVAKSVACLSPGGQRQARPTGSSGIRIPPGGEPVISSAGACQFFLSTRPVSQFPDP